jgi:hypothetical protein
MSNIDTSAYIEQEDERMLESAKAKIASLTDTLAITKANTKLMKLRLEHQIERLEFEARLRQDASFASKTLRTFRMIRNGALRSVSANPIDDDSSIAVIRQLQEDQHRRMNYLLGVIYKIVGPIDAKRIQHEFIGLAILDWADRIG